MKFSVSNGKLFFCTLLFILALAGFMPARASAEEPAKAPEEPKPWTVSADVLSQYIFRGVAFSRNSAVFQPSASVSLYGFTANIWSNIDSHQSTNNPNIFLKNRSVDWNETDFTLSYTRELFKNFSATVGTVYYRLENSAFDAFEVYGGASYTFPWLTVAFTMYREVAHFPGWWFQLDLTRSFPLPYIEGMSLDLGATFGYLVLEDKLKTVLDLAGNTGSYSEPHSGTVQAALKIPFAKYFTVAPKIGLAFPLTGGASDYIKGNSWDKEDVHFFGGFNVTANF